MFHDGKCITKACELWNVNNNVTDIYKEPLGLKDTISDKLNWTKLGPYSKGDDWQIFPTILSSYSPEWIDSEEVKNNGLDFTEFVFGNKN